ncbi:MAG: phosphomannomutase, partial [Gemmatimonadetes bacterium 21-71-4]
MNINGDMFRAYDIRGIAGGDLTDDAAYLVGRAFATYLARERPPGPVVVGRDNRPSGDTLQPALVRGLLDSGRDVVDIGVVPTPVLYWALRKLPVVGGAQVTASHNPREYNGVKLSVDTDALDGERLQDLLAFVREDALVPPARPPAGRRAESLLDQYVRDIVARAGRPSCPLRVVMDCGNGTASVVAPALFRTLGVDHTPLFCESDGTFPNHPPDPSVAANLRALSETVRATGADLGVAFDGDADRIGVVDDRGDFVPGDRLLAIYAQEVLDRTGRGQPIVFDVKASRALSEAIRAAGGVPIMWKT